MTPDEIDFLGALVRQRSGIVIGRDKAYLIENRLAPLAAQCKLADVSALVGRLRSARDEPLEREMVEAMTTNETLFFRDGRPFDLLREKILPQLTSRHVSGDRALRIWSAACSTGQEPYSIAILLAEEGVRLTGWRFSIVATDIARTVLTKARAGIYTQFEVQRGMPIRLLVKYFQQTGTYWELGQAVRDMVEFREHNIVTDPPPQSSCDLIFCRNLLIYFDEGLKRQVLDKLATFPDAHKAERPTQRSMEVQP